MVEVEKELMPRIIQSGNSRTLSSIPPEYLRRLGLDTGSPVSVTFDEERHGILIQPEIQMEGVDAEFLARIDRIIERYRPALESLAKR